MIKQSVFHSVFSDMILLYETWRYRLLPVVGSFLLLVFPGSESGFKGLPCLRFGVMPMLVALFCSTLCFWRGPPLCPHCDRLPGNILKVKSVHLDSSGDHGADSSPLACCGKTGIHAGHLIS